MQRRPSIDTKLALWSLAIFLVLMAVFVPSFVLRQRQESSLREIRERFTSAQVAERFNQFVSTRLRILELLEYTRVTLDDSERFAIWSQRIQEKVRGFYAINWVDPRGVITAVFPEERNTAALGRNLLERVDTRPYLTAARDAHTPVMSHIIDLYQGRPGVVLYLPIFDGNEFKGWTNGVFTEEELVGSLLLTGEFDSYYLSIRFPGHPEKEFVHGALKSGRQSPVVYPVEVLNQHVEIRVAPNVASESDDGSRQWTGVIFGLVTVTSLVLSICAYMLMLSRKRLEQRLEKERVHGVLLNLLVHDIINPLMIVRFGGETAQRMATPELKSPIEKVLYGVAQINDVISRVRDMRAAEAGRFVPKLAAVDVNALIEASRQLFEQRINAKGLQATFEPCAANPSIMIDRVIFQNNVLNNLLSNAVKFTEKGGTISMRCTGNDGKFVYLELRDQGVGMSEAIRSNLFLENFSSSSPGTLGEKGTGIGMLQVRTYMKLFGGRITVESKPQTESPNGHGTIFRLSIPQATQAV